MKLVVKRAILISLLFLAVIALVVTYFKVKDNKDTEEVVESTIEVEEETVILPEPSYEISYEDLTLSAGGEEAREVKLVHLTNTTAGYCIKGTITIQTQSEDGTVLNTDTSEFALSDGARACYYIDFVEGAVYVGGYVQDIEIVPNAKSVKFLSQTADTVNKTVEIAVDDLRIRNASALGYFYSEGDIVDIAYMNVITKDSDLEGNPTIVFGGYSEYEFDNIEVVAQGYAE